MKTRFAVSADEVAVAPETGTWYRALQTRFIYSALATTHTETAESRFNIAGPGSPGFEILYLAENQFVALLEVQAIFGSASRPAALVPNPQSTWTTLNVSVSLQHVADLTDPSFQDSLGITAQELTGDWRGYRIRGADTTVKAPTGLAPTQVLGAALHALPKLEGFKTLSSKAPYNQILVVFPKKLKQGSKISWLSPLTGQRETLSPGGDPYKEARRQFFSIKSEFLRADESPLPSREDLYE
ncbi:MAG TPA: RES family NAD+ phosphorylase [Thermoanaerobaculia bacterium]|nr:RES family NAD+ phosphorylase [Thermoanaerobaculia bacterium]